MGSTKKAIFVTIGAFAGVAAGSIGGPKVAKTCGKAGAKAGLWLADRT
jgi:hypothetical protein